MKRPPLLSPPLPPSSLSHPLCVNPASDPLAAPPEGGGRGSLIGDSARADWRAASRKRGKKTAAVGGRGGRGVCGRVRRGGADRLGRSARGGKGEGQCEPGECGKKRHSPFLFCRGPRPTQGTHTRLASLSLSFPPPDADRGVGHLLRPRAPPRDARPAARARRAQVRRAAGATGGQSDGRCGGERERREEGRGRGGAIPPANAPISTTPPLTPL